MMRETTDILLSRLSRRQQEDPLSTAATRRTQQQQKPTQQRLLAGSVFGEACVESLAPEFSAEVVAGEPLIPHHASCCMYGCFSDN